MVTWPITGSAWVVDEALEMGRRRRGPRWIGEGDGGSGEDACVVWGCVVSTGLCHFSDVLTF